MNFHIYYIISNIQSLYVDSKLSYVRSKPLDVHPKALNEELFSILQV